MQIYKQNEIKGENPIVFLLVSELTDVRRRKTSTPLHMSAKLKEPEDGILLGYDAG
jgi:hypothetical protein